MPVYDKPMIYYPLSTLMLAGIRDILIITTPEDCRFRSCWATAAQWGISLTYAGSRNRTVWPQAFLIGEDSSVTALR